MFFLCTHPYARMLGPGLGSTTFTRMLMKNEEASDRHGSLVPGLPGKRVSLSICWAVFRRQRHCPWCREEVLGLGKLLESTLYLRGRFNYFSIEAAPLT